MADRPIIPEIIEPDESLHPELRTLRKFARIMDNFVQIPGTRRGVGLDAALGLIPGVGDAVAALFSTWVIMGALRHRVPPRKIARMIVNIAIDLSIGLIPVVGDIFDFFFTENLSNVDLLIRHRDRTRPPRSWTSIAAVFGLILALLTLVSVALVVWLLVGLIEFSRRLGGDLV